MYCDNGHVLSVRQLGKVMQPLAVPAPPPTKAVSSTLFLLAFSLYKSLPPQIISATAELTVYTVTPTTAVNATNK